MQKQWVVVSAVLALIVAVGLLVFEPSRTRGPSAEPGRTIDAPRSAPTTTLVDRAFVPPPTLATSRSRPAATPPPASLHGAPEAKMADRQYAEQGIAGGVEGGVAGGVVGGVFGGVVGGVVGGIPDRALEHRPPAPALRKAERDDEMGFERERDPADFNTEAYDRIRDNPFRAAAAHPLSTFSIDVDTASYANVRRFLESGARPPKDAVRIEELLNYFRYDYPQPKGGEPFSVTTEVVACPWKPEHRLVLVGLQGRRIEDARLPPRNLVFLLDVSGSMNEPRKLPLLKASMGLLVEELRAQDRVAIVVYAGASGLVLPPTPGDRKAEIREAIDRLGAGGTTAGGAGIRLAYEVAAGSFVKGGINRVILGTDGDFNVGLTSQGDLVRLIEEKRQTGVFLSVLGFGEGNLKDSTMEKLADHGNGNYSYVDRLAEGHKVLVSEAGATLVTIAKDVKIQVEWNPQRVAAYRLIGYENRVLAAEDFGDDRKDAGEIGAGHAVTALYEVVPQGVAIALPGVDPLKYQGPASAAGAASSGELLTLKLRHKQPDGEVSRLQSVAVRDEVAPQPSTNARFAAAVAAFGMLLRESEHKGASDWALVRELADGALGDDPQGYRAQFRNLVGLAQSLGDRPKVSARR